MDGELYSYFKHIPISMVTKFPVLRYKYDNQYYYNNIDPVNNDPKYRERICENIYTRLVEKWLYKSRKFEILLPYFKINKEGKNGLVSIHNKISDINENVKYSDLEKKYIFDYIEKNFISKKLVKKMLNKFTKAYNVKWYDLIDNGDRLKEFFAERLDKIIREVVKEVGN